MRRNMIIRHIRISRCLRYRIYMMLQYGISLIIKIGCYKIHTAIITHPDTGTVLPS